MTEPLRAPAARLVVRSPNHLGELILALPALERLARVETEDGRGTPILALPGWLLPILRLSSLADGAMEVVELSDRRDMRRAAHRIRSTAGGAPVRGITLSPSFRSALLLRRAGARWVRGTDTGGRRLLLTDPVDRRPLLEGHRVNEFLVLAGFASVEPPPAPSLPGVGRAREAWRAANAFVPDAPDPVIGLFPGANGPSRRWPADRFEVLARGQRSRGRSVRVFGGAEDTALTAGIAAATDGVVDLGGRTSLVELAGAMLACDVLVTNDTGPMHLAAALGVPVVALEGPADVRQTRPLGPRVTLVGRFELPCVPCVRNRCPRSGRGYELPEARKECMRLIGVSEVEDAVERTLEKEPP